MTRRYLKDDNTGREYLAYVSPGSVRYDKEDIDLLLPWLSEMREGVGPADPGKGKDAGIRGSGGHSSRNEAWCNIAAELDNRLAMTGTDHYILEDYYSRYDYESMSGKNDDRLILEDLANINNLPWWDIGRRIRSVKSYIASGSCRRWLECSACSNFARCEKKKKLEHKACTYRQWVRSRAGKHGVDRKASRQK